MPLHFGESSLESTVGLVFIALILLHRCPSLCRFLIIVAKLSHQTKHYKLPLEIRAYALDFIQGLYFFFLYTWGMFYLIYVFILNCDHVAMAKWKINLCVWSDYFSVLRCLFLLFCIPHCLYMLMEYLGKNAQVLKCLLCTEHYQLALYTISSIN